MYSEFVVCHTKEQVRFNTFQINASDFNNLLSSHGLDTRRKIRNIKIFVYDSALLLHTAPPRANTAHSTPNTAPLKTMA